MFLLGKVKKVYSTLYYPTVVQKNCPDSKLFAIRLPSNDRMVCMHSTNQQYESQRYKKIIIIVAKEPTFLRCMLVNFALIVPTNDRLQDRSRK